MNWQETRIKTVETDLEPWGKGKLDMTLVEYPGGSVLIAGWDGTLPAPDHVERWCDRAVKQGSDDSRAWYDCTRLASRTSHSQFHTWEGLPPDLQQWKQGKNLKNMLDIEPVDW